VKLETFTEVIRPAISDRKGSFYAIGTFKNSNGALGQLYDMAEQDGWFRRIYAADTSGALDEEELRDAAKVMSREEYAREYECVRVSAVKNSVLGRLVDEADEADRITSVPYDPALPVTTAWDLGIGDATSIWFMQQVGRGEVRLIDYYEASGEGLPHYAQVLKDKGYTYGEHIAPHDIGVRELGTGKTRVEVAAGFGISFRVLPRISQNTRSEIDERIEASRMLLPRCYFDKKKTAIGVEALRSWHRDTTPTGELKHHPVHDWSSHAADAFGYLAMGIRQVGSVERPRAKVKRY
jgi:phage terminase large subunit